MNYLQLQKDLLTLRTREKQNRNKIKPIWLNYRGKVGIGTEYYIYFIDEEDLFIDLKKEKYDGRIFESVDNLEYDLFYKGLTKEENGETFRILEGEEFKVYVNVEFFKYMKNNFLSYKIAGKNKPVFCYRGENLLAILMPIRKQD